MRVGGYRKGSAWVTYPLSKVQEFKMILITLLRVIGELVNDAKQVRQAAHQRYPYLNFY